MRSEAKADVYRHCIEATADEQEEIVLYVDACSWGFSCWHMDHEPFIPTAGFHQIHIFIFILAIVHIIYSLLIVALAMWSVSYWTSWERLAASKEESSHEGDVRLAKDTTFVRSRLPIPASWMQKPIIPYVVAFFRQFCRPVGETEYTTLRHGFIQSHTPGHVNFNFHNYIWRSLQDDFQHVVGISPALWMFACIWLLVNVEECIGHVFCALGYVQLFWRQLCQSGKVFAHRATYNRASDTSFMWTSYIA
ncbi:hypothetical protein L7F22_042392 [Adiantum nelumboides]|nr:hypothetical protein [Adiantum nelumboides]